MIRKVGVLGAGQMGNGIAHLFAHHLYEVTLFDIDDAQLTRAIATIRENLERQALKGSVDSARISEIMGRITPTSDAVRRELSRFHR